MSLDWSRGRRFSMAGIFDRTPHHHPRIQRLVADALLKEAPPTRKLVRYNVDLMDPGRRDKES